jgi:hypothetical protein
MRWVVLSFAVGALLAGCGTEADNLELTITAPSGNQSIGVGESIAFSAKTEGGTSPVDYAWSFDLNGVGGASPGTGSSSAPGSVTFSSPGTYDVYVEASSADGQSDAATLTVTASYTTTPANFTATAGNESIALSWSHASHPDYTNVLIRRDTSTYPAASTDGDPIYSGPATSHTDSGLTNGTQYFYTAFSYDASFNVGAGINATATPADTTAPANVTSFAAAQGASGVINLSWTNPTDTDFVKVLIRRATTGYPFYPTDGTTVYDDTGTSTSDTGLTPGTTYYYTAFPYDEVPNYSSGAYAEAVAP